MRKVLVLLGVLPLLFVILLVGLQIWGAEWARTQLISEIRKGCPKCEVEIDSLDFSLLRQQVWAGGLHWKGDPKASTALEVTAESLHAQLDWGNGGDLPFAIRWLDLDGLRVTIREESGEGSKTGAPFPPAGTPFLDLPAFRVGETHVRQGALVYEYRIFGKSAQIRVNDVDAKVSRIATRPGLLAPHESPTVDMEAHARLEQSGKVLVKVRLDSFAQKNDDQVEVRVENQEMAELNPFFDVEDGIQLTGVMKLGHAIMYLRQGHLSGTLRCEYEQVAFKIRTTPERGALTTALLNLGQQLKFSKTRPRGPKDQPVAKIEARRDPYQSVIKFMLKGLKKAVMEILSS